MANTKIYPSTSSVKLDLKIVKEDSNDDPMFSNEIVEDWSSIDHPEYVVSMTHSLNGGGRANDLSLTLYHHLDPYKEDNSFGYDYRKEDKFGFNTNSPSYLMQLIAQGFGTLYFRYGYVYDTDISTAFDDGSSKSTTEWFKMYITDVSSQFDPNGITYSITAVSTLVFNTNLNGGVSYDWWNDTEEKLYEVANSAQKTYIEESKNITNISEASSPQITSRIFCIIDYISKKAGYEAVFANFTNLANYAFNELGIFTQGADETDIQFINKILSYTITYEKLASKTYPSPDGGTTTIDNCYYWKHGWTIFVDDSEKKINVNYSVIDYTRGDLREIAGQHISTLSPDEQEKYKVFYTEINPNGSQVGSLFYNFSTFNRDIFDSQTISVEDVFKYSPDIAKPTTSSLYISTDIISLNLQYPIVAGLAGAYASLNNTSQIDESGAEVSSNNDAFTADGTYNTPAIFQILTEADFKKIMNQIYVQGSVTVPGIARVVSMLSLVNVFVYISNQLDVTSGQYMILDQVDTITAGVYTTQFGIIKSRTFDNATVYELAKTPSSTQTALELATDVDAVYATEVWISMDSKAKNENDVYLLKKGVSYKCAIVSNEGATASYGGFQSLIFMSDDAGVYNGWGTVDYQTELWENDHAEGHTRIVRWFHITPKTSIPTNTILKLKAHLITDKDENGFVSMDHIKTVKIIDQDVM